MALVPSAMAVSPVPRHVLQAVADRPRITSRKPSHRRLTDLGPGVVLTTAMLGGLPRRSAVRRQRWTPVALQATAEMTGSATSSEERVAKARDNVKKFNFDELLLCSLEELNELYIDALWYYYQEGPDTILTQTEYDKLKNALVKLKSPFLKLKKDEVAFMEACISYYRGNPVMSDEDYKRTRERVSKSGRRKDTIAFILYERAKQFLDQG